MSPFFTKSLAVTRVGQLYCLYPKAIVRLSVQEKTISHSSHIHTTVTLLYQTLQKTPQCDTVIQRTWVMAAGRYFAFKIVAESLQTETWLLTAYKNSLFPYLTVPPPTHYNKP